MCKQIDTTYILVNYGSSYVMFFIFYFSRMFQFPVSSFDNYIFVLLSVDLLSNFLFILFLPFGCASMLLLVALLA